MTWHYAIALANARGGALPAVAVWSSITSTAEHIVVDASPVLPLTPPVCFVATATLGQALGTVCADASVRRPCGGVSN